MPLDRKHILRQSATLLRLGLSEMDIERSITWVEQRLPEGADPATWIPTAAQLSEDVISEAAVVDSRNAWWNDRNVPRRFRALLDARKGA